MKAQSNTQSQAAKLNALRNRHSKISNEIDTARKSPGIADYILQDLKKQKLQLKDEIAQMDRRVAH